MTILLQLSIFYQFQYNWCIMTSLLHHLQWPWSEKCLLFRFNIFLNIYWGPIICQYQYLFQVLFQYQYQYKLILNPMSKSISIFASNLYSISIYIDIEHCIKVNINIASSAFSISISISIYIDIENHFRVNINIA